MSIVGKTIGRYRVIEQLGQGGMAVVYKAYDTRLERDVAMKLIRTETIPPIQLERLLKRFEREAKAQAQFEHPNIVTVYDYGEYQGSPYLVMAYRPGGTLKQRIGKPLNYAEAAALLAPVADALAYAHRRDVLHRDVKPSNILMGEEGVPSLTDFGIAKLLGGVEEATLTGTGLGVGTPQYMAPEQWEGKPVAQTDIYALGVVFYELVTGRRPFDADTPVAIIKQLVSDPMPRLKDYAPDLPEHVEKVIYKALAKEPEDRYASMAEFGKVLEELGWEGTPSKEGGQKEERQERLGSEQPKQAGKELVTPAASSIAHSLDEDETVDVLALEVEVKKEKPRKTWTAKQLSAWMWGGAGGVVLVGALVFGVVKGLDGVGPFAMLTMETQTAAILPTTMIAPTSTSTLAPTTTATITPTVGPTTTPIGGGMGKLVFASDRDGDMEIYLIDVNGENLQKLTDNDIYDSEPVWSKDGSKIAYISEHNGYNQIFVMDADGSNKQQITNDNEDHRNLEWGGAEQIYFDASVNAWVSNVIVTTEKADRPKYSYHYYKKFQINSYAFATKNSESIDYWLITPEIIVSHVLYPNLEFNQYDQYHFETRISHEGSTLTYCHLNDLNYIDMENDHSKTILRMSGHYKCSHPSISHGTTQIAFISNQNNSSDIKIVNLDGSGDRWLIQDDFTNLMPKWSPSDEFIVFYSDRDGDEDIYIINADGSNLIQITNEPGFDGFPDWSP